MSGWRFRRSIRLPLGARINLSRSGVGASVGVRGFRVGRDARGHAYSQASIPGTGIYRRDYYRTTHLARPWGLGLVFLAVILILMRIYS